MEKINKQLHLGLKFCDKVSNFPFYWWPISWLKLQKSSKVLMAEHEFLAIFVLGSVHQMNRLDSNTHTRNECIYFTLKSSSPSKPILQSDRFLIYMLFFVKLTRCCSEAQISFPLWWQKPLEKELCARLQPPAFFGVTQFGGQCSDAYVTASHLAQLPFCVTHTHTYTNTPLNLQT